jgi:hypothetical protein
MTLLATLIALATFLAWRPARRFAPAESLPTLIAVGLVVVVLFQLERLA